MIPIVVFVTGDYGGTILENPVPPAWVRRLGPFLSGSGLRGDLMTPSRKVLPVSLTDAVKVFARLLHPSSSLESRRV